MLTSSASFNFYTEQTPSVLVEMTDFPKRGFVHLFNILIMLFNQAFDERTGLLKKFRVFGFISLFRGERADSKVNPGTIYTSPFPSEGIPFPLNRFSVVDCPQAAKSPE